MVEPPSQRDPTRRFSDRVEYYVRSRPKYPPVLLEFCRGQLGLVAGHRIADIGSGTGFLSEVFVHNGNEVFAVEPNAEMRAAAETALGGFPNFHSVDARAEATGLENSSVDCVTAGQAFHWFDRARCREEFKRILRPDGWVVLAWNQRQSVEGFAGAYEKIVQEFQIDLAQVEHKAVTARSSDALSKFFHPGNYAVETFANPQWLDLDGVIARAHSSSYLPLPSQPRADEMLERLHHAFAAHAQDGKVKLYYVTRIFYGRLI